MTPENISDTERREVALRLRGNPEDTLIPHRTGRHHGMGCHEAADRFWNMCDRIKEAGNYDIAFSTTSVLADLIEPSESGQNLDRNQDTVQKELPAVLKVPECDRDGLLTVAETMDQDAFLYREAAKSFTECGNHDAAEICYEAAGEYNGYAKVIREALGVER